MKPLSYDIRQIRPAEAAPLLEKYHPYKGGKTGKLAVYAWGVFEGGQLVAAYLWNPPPYGSARSVCPSAPWGVLSLSRMVAVPRSSRALNHVSKPLRHQMRRLIDRDRWPALVTYSDEGLGHTGHVYKCSGWKKTSRRKSAVYLDSSGARVSSYSNGSMTIKGTPSRTSFIQRWEHHAPPAGADVAAWMEERGWFREAIPGKVWASGKQAHTIAFRGKPSR